MIRVKMSDIYGTEVAISESNSGYFRIDLKGESFPQQKHSVTGEDIPTCISFNENQARAIQSAINSYFDNE